MSYSTLRLSQVPDSPPFPPERDRTLYLLGDASLLFRRRVAVIGSREATPQGLQRAARLAKELAQAGIVVMSGLAKGIDTIVHETAMQYGKTIAVLGTPLGEVYPPENAVLQQKISEEHLLVSPFHAEAKTSPASFPDRNRVMAAISHATAVIEATDTSGTLHQATACLLYHRPLFLARSLVENPKVKWPSRFLLLRPGGTILDHTQQILEAI